MEINLDAWEKLPTQKELYDTDHIDTLMMSSGLGAGKTHVLCRKMLKLSALNQGYPGGFLCPSYKDFKRDVKPEFEDILEYKLNLKKNKHWWFHGSDFEYRFIWNKKPLYIFSGEKPIAGPNLAYCGINEFSLIQFERIKEMLRRVRVKGAPFKQRCLVGTPEDIYCWLEDFIELQEAELEKNPNAFKLLQADTRENTFIDDAYRAHLESMLDSQSIKVFASGEIVNLSGKNYYYAFDKDVNIAPVEYDHNEVIYVGMDFNVGNMAASFSHKRIHNNKYRQEFFDELVLRGNSDTDQLAQAIVTRYNPKMCLINCDASGKSRKTSGKTDVEILKKYFPSENIRYKNANPRHRYRQLLINGMLDKGEIIIDPRCKELNKDMRKVQQKVIDFSKEKKDDKLTHLSDGLDYVIDWEYKMDINKDKYKVKKLF